jgi:hypothetical protein
MTSRLGIQRDPNPLLVTFPGDETPPLVSLDRQKADSRRTQQLKESMPKSAGKAQYNLATSPRRHVRLTLKMRQISRSELRSKNLFKIY